MATPAFRSSLLTLGTLAFSMVAFGGDLRIHVINVGWGESVLVEGPSGVTVLLDTGKADKTASRVIPYLQSHISKLDYFVLGHNHDDHGGGAAALVNAFPPEHSYYNGSTINKTAGFMKNWFAAYAGIGKPSPLGMAPGATIDLGDGATITCILSDGKVLNQAAVVAKLQAGNPAYTLPVPTEANATSMALLVKYKGFDYLYTGDLDGQEDLDLETPTITSILLSDLPNVRTPEKGIDVLQVGHHASKTATNAGFVDLCGPKLAVVSVGPNQGFGLPNSEAVDDVLLAKGVKVLQTDEGKLGDSRMTRSGFVVGHVLISTNGSTYTVSADPSAIDQVAQPSVQDEGAEAGLPFTWNVDSLPEPPADTQAPVVTAVSNGTSATIQFIASATDNVGAVKADFLVDGQVIGSATGAAAAQARFTCSFDSRSVINGNHTLVVKATDAEGNQGTSPAITFPVNNPVVDTQAPAVIASVSGTLGSITLAADTTDNVGAVKASFLVDGVSVGTATAAAAKQVRFTLALDSKTLANGSHTLVVKATDAANNTGTSASQTFTVNNPPPVSTSFEEVETNDTLVTANAVGSTVTSIKGYFPSASDNDDWYALAIPAGRTLTINMTGPTASAQNYNLYLCSATGTKVAKSEGIGTTERISYKNTATTTKTFYINIKRVTSSSRVTPYILTLTR